MQILKPYQREEFISLKTGKELLKSWLQLLPTGPYWEWKKYEDSNAYKYFLGIFNVLADIYNEQFYILWRESSILTTIDEIARWESLVGIPDDLFSNVNVSLERRRYNVLSKIFPSPLVSRQDFIRFLSIAGYEFGVDYVDLLVGTQGYYDYAGVYNMYYNIEFLSQIDVESGSVYLILYNDGLDNEKIINILNPIISLTSTFKQTYI